MSAQHLPAPDRLRHLRAMGLQPLRLRGAEQEQAPAQDMSKAEAGHGAAAARTPPGQQPGTQVSASRVAGERIAPIEGPRLRLWFADVQQADALNGPYRRLLQDVLRSVGTMPEQALVMEPDDLVSRPTAPLTPALSPIVDGGEGARAESAASPSRSNATAAIASAPSPANPPEAASASTASEPSPTNPLEAASAPTASEPSPINPLEAASASIASEPSPSNPLEAASASIASAPSPTNPPEAASAPSPPLAGERAGVRGQTVNPGELPILAFGSGAPAGSTRVAALARLRDPLEKRIAWPMLRALRRRLQGGS